jgi:hypothetical protein
MPDMSPAIEKVEQEFKKLSPNEQAEVFERFAKLLYGEDDGDPAFIETLKRRVAEIESGSATGRDAFAVLNEIKAKHSQ